MFKLPSEIRSTRRKQGGVIVSIGGVLLGVAAALYRWEIGKDLLTTPLTIGALILIGIGATHVLVALVVPRNTSEAYDCRTAAATEIAKLLKFAAKYMGPVEMPGEAYLQSLLTANPDLYYIVEDKAQDDTGERRMIGCFTILPLKQGAVNRLEQGEMQGAGISADHIVTKKKRTAKGFYIGIVIGVDPATSGITLKKLKIELDRLCKSHRSVKVFARPVTDAGLKLLRKTKFKNVINGAEPEMNIVCRKLWE